MRKLALVSLAAVAAALPSVADAQPRAGHRQGHGAGHSWGQSGQHVQAGRHGQRVVVRQSGQHGQRVVVRQGRHGQAVRQGRHGQRVIVRHGGQHMGMGGGHQRRDFRHIRRFDRGHFVPQFWWGPQFHVQHWQMYGFPQPMPGHRWVRFYDDAYMIDGHGRVYDSRHDMDWDRYDDRWSYDERGIPAYAEDDEYGYDERDYRGHHGRGDRGGWDYSEYGRV